MNKEIKKLSNEELLQELNYSASGTYSEIKKTPFTYMEIRDEIKNRLSKNSVEDYKKRLVEELCKVTKYSKSDNASMFEVINIINNLK